MSNSEGITGIHREHALRLPIHHAMRVDIVAKGHIDITHDEANQLRICNRDFMLALVKVREIYFARKRTVTMINKLKK